MATLPELEDALRNADAAGDAGAAKILADEIVRMRGDTKTQAQKFDELPTWQKPFVAADDIVRQVVDGMTFGYGDKFAAKANEALGMGDYETNLAAQRAMTEQAGERAGLAGSAASIAGSLLPVSKAMKYGVTATAIPKVPAFGGAVLDGAAIGALNAAGHDQNIAVGAGFGGVAGAAGDVVGKVATKYVTPAIKDTAETLSRKAKAAYADLDAAGVMYSPNAIADLLANTKANYTRMGFHPKNQPGAAVALEELERVVAAGLPVNSTGMQSIKELIRGGYAEGARLNPKNNALLTDAIKQLDDMILNPKPGQVFAGDGNRAAKAYAEANKAYSQSKKMDKVTGAIKEAEDRASTTGSGGNVENAIRQELRKLRKDKGWTPDERAALRKAYGGTLPRTIARWAGNMSPMGNGLMGGLWGGLGSGAGLATGGASVPLTLMAAALTSGAKIAGQKASRSAAQQLQDLVAVGGKKANLPKPTAKQMKMIEALRAASIAGGAVSASD